MIGAIVVDTDVISYLFKGDTRCIFLRTSRIGEDRDYLVHDTGRASPLDHCRNWGETRKQDLESFLTNYSIVLSNSDLCAEWAEVAQSAIRNGRPITNADAWIAATALALGVPLLTNNWADFQYVEGLTVISDR